MAAITQDNRQLAIETPLGKDVLLLTSFSGREEISRLFRFHLVMYSPRDTISAQEIVGKNVTFRVRLAGGGFRHVNGFVARFSAGTRETGLRRYEAEVVPWLWFLTQTADCRIFQNKSVPQMLQQVFSDLAFSEFDPSEVKGKHENRDYCVQYRETDFNFVSRLMEEEGIFYYFRHEQGKHTLVLADQKGAYKDLPEKDVEYEYSYSTQQVRDRISNWEHQYQYIPGKWSQTDYNFVDQPARAERTPADLLKAGEQSTIKMAKMEKYEVYDYPGGYEDKDRGQPLTKIRMEEEEAAHDTVTGVSTCKTFAAGGKFKIKRHDCKAEEGKTFVVTSIYHSATEPAQYEGGQGVPDDYKNAFTCIPDSVLFRPPRRTPKPVVQGSQTAVVVGPDGEEIWPDKYGRVKVQFFWDREGKRNDETSCWIRCAQSSAGKGWGSMFIPRIGQEVVVSYLEGDPDRPLITGVVYNDDQMPPYTLPDEKTKSYIKTNSTKGGDGFNEIRFEDKKGHEQVFVHAQGNMDLRVNGNSMEAVGGDRHLIVGGQKDGGKSGDQWETVYRDKFSMVHRYGSQLIGGDMILTVGGVDGPGNQDIMIKADKKEHIKQNSHLHVLRDRAEHVDGGQSLTVGGSQQEKVGLKHALEAGTEIHLKSGGIVVIEAAAQLSLKVGGNFIDINPVGIFIQGTMVMINSGGAPAVGSGSQPAGKPERMAEALPFKPVAADDAKTGQKSTPY
jgi:type VI secretion system secreted protein VgrG